MDDREIVAAIVAGDLGGLASAYDQYAESLYGYCRWMMHDPAGAAEAVVDTFVIAAGRLGGLGDPRRLRPWLYAVARNECHRRLRAADVGLDEAADIADSAADLGGNTEREELRRLIRVALSGFNPGEREILELSLRHDLDGTDLAAVLGVSRQQAHALASRAGDQLEKALGALIVARTGRRACPTLDMLLTAWDGRLTVLMRKRIIKHIGRCDVCDLRRRGALRPAALFGMAPLAAPPFGLRDEVLRLCADDSDETMAYRHEVTQWAGPFGPNGFPEAIRQPKQRILVFSRIAAAAGILIAIVSTGMITALALSGPHTQHRLDAASSSSTPGTASTPESSGASETAAAEPSVSVSPTVSQPATTEQPPAATPSKSAKAKPSPSASPSPSTTTTSASPFPTVRPTPTPSATPTPTATPTVTPTTTPTSTPTSTATG